MHRQSAKIRSIIVSAVLSISTLTATTMALISSTGSVAHAQVPGVSRAEHSTSKVTIFTDFQCPACKKYAPSLVALEANSAGRVEVEFRNYPLPQHKNANLAAQAAEAARLQGQFGPMHDLLFSQQDSWATAADPHAVFQNMAAGLGLDTDKFVTDLDSSSVKKKIAADITAGDTAGLEVTPTAIFGGTKYSGKQLTQLSNTINATLSHKATL